METWVLSFGAKWKDVMPLLGAGFTALVTAAAAIFATWRLNKSMKRTEFFLKFTERFHNIMLSKHNLQLRLEEEVSAGVKKVNDETAKKEANELYRQIFGLMFDEFFAYRRGLLDRSAFIEWLRWRNHEYKSTGQEPNFKIGTLSYKAAWDEHAKSPVVRSEFTEFLKRIHDITPAQGPLDKTIKKVVLKFGTPAERFRSEWGAIAFAILAIVLAVLACVIIKLIFW